MKKLTKQLIHLIILIGLVSCNHTRSKKEIAAEVLRLDNKTIPLTKFLDNADSCRKAILFLDSATSLDNTCYTCYANKLIFQSALKDYNNAILTINNCIRIEPASYDLYLRGGMIYEKISDTINSRKYFQEASRLCSTRINSDKEKTFKQKGNLDWFVVRIDQAIILKLLNENERANALLKNIYNIRTTYLEDTLEIKKSILSFIDRDRKLIIDSIFK